MRDDKSNTTKVEYDNLGRRTVIDNPDAGKTETRYDVLSACPASAIDVPAAVF